MKRPLIAAALVFLALSPAALAAEAPAAAGFLVMDTDRLAAESTAMRGVFDQIAKRRDVEAAAYNMALDKLEKEFEPVSQARDTMDPAEYQKALEQYDTIKAQIDGVLQSVQNEMTAAGEKAIGQFNAVVASVGEEVRRERGAARFLDGAAALYVRPGSGYDVTDEVIRRVNARLPDIKVEFPPRETPAAAKKK